MSTLYALGTRDILQEVCLNLSRSDRARFSLVHSVWRLACLQPLWSAVPGLQPLLRLVPDECCTWSIDTGHGKDKARLHLRLKLSDDQCQMIRQRSCYVQRLAFDYADALIELAIYAAFEADYRLTPLPSLHTIAFDLAKPLPPSCLLRVPPAVAAITGIAYHCRLEDLIIPSARSVIMGGVVHFMKYATMLHIDGQPLNLVRRILDSQRVWRFEELCIRTLQAVPADVDSLLSTIARHCTPLLRLEVFVDSMPHDQLWPMTAETLRHLSALQNLTDLNMEIPMFSLISDSEWMKIVSHWRHLVWLRFVPRLPWDIPDTAFPPPACTLNAIVFIIMACPHLLDLALPGVNCTLIPSASRLEKALLQSPLRSGYPLLSLEVHDSPVDDPSAVGFVFRRLFPNLDDIWYGRWPWEIEVWEELKDATRPRGIHLDGWNEVEQYLLDNVEVA